MPKCVVTVSYNKYLKSNQLIKTGVTEVNSTKSRAKFLHVAFSPLISFHGDLSTFWK